MTSYSKSVTVGDTFGPQMIADNRHYEKVGNNTPVCIDDETCEFDLPDSWVLCRFSSIAEIFTGNSINETEKQKKYTGLTNGYNYIGTKDVGFDHTVNYNNGVKIPFEQNNFRIAHKFTPLLCIEGGSAGRKIGILQEDVCFGNKLCAFESFGVDPKYIYYFLQSSSFTKVFKEKTTGIIGGVSVNTLKHLLFAVPPLAEQARIVAEIEKFEPLIAEYDKLEQQASKLDDEIYDKLKKSILQYAIQGKLVPQDPNDEPASVLLERIRAEKKAKLGKKYVDSCIYKGDDNCYYEKVGTNEPVRLDNLPFDIPDSWCWARLKDVTFNHGQKIPNATFSYIDIGSIDNVKQKLSAKENIIEPEKAPSRARKIVERGDVLYATVRPYLHNMCIVDKDFSHEPIASTGFAVLAVKRGIKNTFLFYYMLSPIFDQYANNSENSKGVAYPAINDEKLYKALIPIPPQNEQQNICKLIDKCFNVLMLKDEG